MKKLLEIIKPCKFNKNLAKEALKELEGQSFLVWYRDGSCEEIYFKDDLIGVLMNDNKKPVRYIFDMNDRIIIDRTIHIEEGFDEYNDKR